jgi:putative N6-adenine-specific DNA methylase
MNPENETPAARPNNAKTFKMIAKTLSGLENVLAQELTELGADKIETGRRMVAFEGDKSLMYKTNFNCRTALRILKHIDAFQAKNPDEVYKHVKQLPWEHFLKGKKTFAIDAVVFSDAFAHSKFVAYRVKDAIVDKFTEQNLQRPSVRITNPDVRIHVHISHTDCTVAFDSSGESLHRRGYRVEDGTAPLSEVLAAGMVLLSGWKGESAFVDPMAGSGTLLIEAALIALNIAPGVFRKNYAFEKWDDFDPELFEYISSDDSKEREFNFKCYGSDVSPRAIAAAAKNVRNAGLEKYVDLKVSSLRNIKNAPDKHGIIITNPPYGERLNPTDLLETYSVLGERLKHVFPGYTAWVMSANKDGFDKIGMKHCAKIALMNGPIECEFRQYELFEGKRVVATEENGKKSSAIMQRIPPPPAVSMAETSKCSILHRPPIRIA